MHEWAKLSRNDPPQYSPFAFSSSTPSIVAAVETGNSSEGFTLPASSAAAVVTILKVEPGGCGAEKAIPASARISPLRGSSAAIPPKRPASAVTAASWRRVSIVVRTGGEGAGRARAITRSPASSTPPGRPASLCSNASSSPFWPTGQVRGNPFA